MPKKHKRKSSQNLSKREAAEYPREPIAAETKKGIMIVLVLVVAFLTILSLFNLAGSLGLYLKQILGVIFGGGLYLVPVILIGVAYVFLSPEKYDLRPTNILGILILIISLCGLLQLTKNDPNTFTAVEGGGYLGYALAFPLQKIMGFWATLISLVALFIISLLLTFNTTLNGIVSHLNIIGLFKKRLTRAEDEYEAEEEQLGESYEEEEEEPEIKEEPAGAEPTKQPAEISVDHDDFKTKKIPPSPSAGKKIKRIPEGLNITFSRGQKTHVEVPLNLLDGKTSKPTSGDIKANILKIQETFKNFGIEVEMGEVNIGPTVTQFTLKPAEGIRLAQIVALQNDLALALAAHPIRIEAPIPGKSLVGIEIPNQNIALVKIKEIINSEKFQNSQGQLTFSLGKDVAGKAWAVDLANMPHLLIAGATGSGKSVCINDIIVSLLYKHSPETLRLILVDPKRVELTTYNGIPHLLTPVIIEVDKTINALRWAVNEMDERYKLFSAVGKRNIKAYNASVLINKLPYIVVIVDELADLMATAPRDVEGAIVRLSQMARATGIHLIVATQRPSVNVITGLIKANITSRIAFAVASGVDSRTIIDSSGAEKLLGKGDMLFMSAEISKPRRLQCAYINDEEIENVVNFWRQQAEPEYQENVTERQGKVSLPGANGFSNDGDDLLEEAKDVLIKAGKASASLLQRRLRVGYARAARILDLLEEQGIIGPADGAKPREILVAEDEFAIAKETTEQYSAAEKNYESDGETDENDEAEKKNETAEAETASEADDFADYGLEENETNVRHDEETAEDEEVEKDYHQPGY
ncbi:MAG: translocase FtsK protein [Parcubacteria group bacterium GW2011_GWA2_43_17]|nr:MAG: translocase FtsK protein [Parcubacteria group bacterium GW2011_GWA2_43_17]KKT93263.1 MAG: translocase FtsK protein [Parcubacteria group bacterium GW2011_GWF2_45_11]KKT97964.1 MAG: translocase FtsK protein [Parcubacteria group bacterium GW2011_GWC2_45_15]OGY92665.1 MAG: hypothetical protein A2260_03465 [Candidatus Komeilibacteria bacterium RIFOXYA2_FULL_45_9]OGY93569.1 MAG: hypothetical protein A3J95_02780 [Candidatus Komeilibacteria bacterium RIFOXYC2_FULL_45_12]HAH04041.1 cell divisio